MKPTYDSDLTVMCKNRSFKLHKSIVLAQSDYLKAAEHFDGTSRDVITIEEEDPEFLNIVFRWMYIGVYNTNSERELLRQGPDSGGECLTLEPEHADLQ